MSIVAVNIKRIIDQKGMKHKAVARLAGYSNPQFSAILCGRKIIKDSDIEAIAKALSVTPNDLFAMKLEEVQSTEPGGEGRAARGA
jgi:transcriptional regulator with XRE-family HTH domain